MYAFEKTAQLLTKTNSELKSQHQVAAKALNSLVQTQFGLLSQGLGNAFTAAEKLPLADKPAVVNARTEFKQGLEKVVGVSQVYTQKGVELFEQKLPVVIDKSFSYAAFALSQAESLTENAITMGSSALIQAKKNEKLKPAIEQAEQIANQLFEKIGVKAGAAVKKAPKKPAAKKAAAPRAKRASAAPKASV